MKVSETLSRLRDDRAKAVLLMETLYETAEKAGRIFTDEEQRQFDDGKAAVAKIDREMGNAEVLLAEQAHKATPIVAPGGLVLSRSGASLRELIRASGLVEAVQRSGKRLVGEAVVKALIGGV